MASPAPTNQTTGGAAKRRRARRIAAGKGAWPLYRVEGDPLTALRGLDLPRGAQVAVIPPDPAAAAQLQEAGLVRAGTVAVKGARPEVSADASAFAPDARARALLRGVEIAHRDLRSAGGAFELDEVRRLLGGISPQAVNKRVREGALLAVPGPSNRRRYPTLQFRSDGSAVAGLERVQAALPSRNPWFVLNFLANPDERLRGQRPIDLLKAGTIEPVVDAARRVAEQGA